MPRLFRDDMTTQLSETELWRYERCEYRKNGVEPSCRAIAKQARHALTEQMLDSRETFDYVQNTAHHSLHNPLLVVLEQHALSVLGRHWCYVLHCAKRSGCAQMMDILRLILFDSVHFVFITLQGFQEEPLKNVQKEN